GLCDRIGAIDAYESLPPEVKTKTSPSTLFQLFLLFEYGVATLDRKSFGRIGSDGKHSLRISIATGYDDLHGAVARIESAARDRNGFRRFVAEGRLT
ncbi:MAG TPA: aspartate aminotransferase, partial [Thermoanaerobaculia bacterium]|nr:aspartate aminotransferase [Thermoanaerobaculia bacterium]